MAIPKKYLVKRGDTATLANVLNEMFYEEKLTLQELRFFLVYLSKINPKEPEKTEVSFTLEEYADILGVELNEAAIDLATKKVLRHVVCVRPDVLGDDVAEEYIYCHLFSYAKMTRRKKDNKWLLTFSCHPEIKDKIFNLNSEFTRMEIWNAVNLSNFQDIRMYMLLRQYKQIGERTIPLKDLKKMIGIDPTAYPEYKVFSRDVLKKCQKALKEHTDICFDFNAVGRPAKSVCFHIYTNEDYQLPDFLTVEKNIVDALPGQTSMFDEPEIEPETEPEVSPLARRLKIVREVLPAEWEPNENECHELFALANKHLPEDLLFRFEEADFWIADYIRMKVLRTKAKRGIDKPLAYLKSLVENDW